MAEFLVVAQGATHADPATDARASYKRGDVVVVKPDGHPWGRMEGLPKFVVVRIPGLDAGRAQMFAESDSVVDLFTAERRMTRRRHWRVRVDAVPLAVRTALLGTGAVTVTWAQVRDFMQDKVTLASAPEVLVTEP